MTINGKQYKIFVNGYNFREMAMPEILELYATGRVNISNSGGEIEQIESKINFIFIIVFKNNIEKIKCTIRVGPNHGR